MPCRFVQKHRYSCAFTFCLPVGNSTSIKVDEYSPTFSSVDPTAATLNSLRIQYSKFCGLKEVTVALKLCVWLLYTATYPVTQLLFSGAIQEIVTVVPDIVLVKFRTAPGAG